MDVLLQVQGDPRQINWCPSKQAYLAIGPGPLCARPKPQKERAKKVPPFSMFFLWRVCQPSGQLQQRSRQAYGHAASCKVIVVHTHPRPQSH